jgi:hypothetical protein
MLQHVFLHIKSARYTQLLMSHDNHGIEPYGMLLIIRLGSIELQILYSALSIVTYSLSFVIIPLRYLSRSWRYCDLVSSLSYILLSHKGDVLGYDCGIYGRSTCPKYLRTGGMVTSATGPRRPSIVEKKKVGFSCAAHRRYRKGFDQKLGYRSSVE